MRVLQINSVCGVGSTGRIAKSIHDILLNQKHESYIAYGRGEVPDHSGVIRIGSKPNNYLHLVKTRLFDAHGFASKRATAQFIRKVEKIAPDIIHIHNIHGYYIHVGLLFNFIKKAGIPVVWTLHDCWPFTGHCAYFDYVRCDRWMTGCYKCPQKKNYPASLMLDRSKYNYHRKKQSFTKLEKTTVVTPSNWLAKLVKQSYLCDYSVEVIPNGIDLSTFKSRSGDFRKRNGLENKFVVLGVASVWEQRKGLLYFQRLVDNLNEDIAVVLVGVSETQKSNLPKGIISIGKTSSIEELAELYSTADVFVNPTLEDNFPTTNIEALACGTPIITFNTGGSPEGIDKQTGIVVEKGSLDGLVSAIEEVGQRGKSYYSAACRERAERYYSKDDRFANYIKMYDRILL